MKNSITRRAWLKTVGAAGASAALASQVSGSSQPVALQSAGAKAPDTAILPLTSTSEVLIPPPGRAFMKFSFDFPEPSVEFEGLRFSFLVFTHENAYGLDRDRMMVERKGEAIEITCSQLVWAGGQEKSAGFLRAILKKTGGFIECDVAVETKTPVKSVSMVVRGVPRGKIASAGQAFFDPRDDEVLLGYPFSGGDLFGPGSARGMETPLVIVQNESGEHFFLSSLDDRVRAKRFYFQPGEKSYKVEAVFENEGWKEVTSLKVPTWRLGIAASHEAAVRAHYQHIERAYKLADWEARKDVPAWTRRIALAVTLHGMHYTGYIFNDYSRMLDVLRWISTRIPGERVLAFISAWDGRYYWDYPIYKPADRMGGEAGFRRLIEEGQKLGFRMMPMFGANAANRSQPIFQRMKDAYTSKIDGDRFDLNWVDWDNDRHQDGWLSYMNLGVDSWRRWLFDRISDAIERYKVDAYFLDIAGGWVNNPKADMHEGTRRLVMDLRAKFPTALACGEMHYDALLEFLPLYHSFSQFAIPSAVQKYARFFQHLSHPAPGRGSTGVHEAGFGRFRTDTLSLNDAQIPTLNVVDDTFEKNRSLMDAVIQRARQRAGISS